MVQYAVVDFLNAALCGKSHGLNARGFLYYAGDGRQYEDASRSTSWRISGKGLRGGFQSNVAITGMWSLKANEFGSSGLVRNAPSNNTRHSRNRLAIGPWTHT